jgi:hypothetical protein
VSAELEGYTPNPVFGDRLVTSIGGGFDFDSDELVVQLEKDFDINEVPGWAETVPTLVFGRYAPYKNREGNDVFKMNVWGMYVLEKNRVKKQKVVTETVTEEPMKQAQEEW